LIDLRVKTCCFTGHRVIPSGEKETIRSMLETAIEKAIQDGYRFFGAGGALGFDTLAAQTVLKLKRQYPHIWLILVLPCINQTHEWKQADIDEYEHIKTLADKVFYTSKEYSYGCMHKRNHHLVDNSNLCIRYMTRLSGGTAYTVRYAENKRVYIRNIASILKSDLR